MLARRDLRQRERRGADQPAIEEYPGAVRPRDDGERSDRRAGGGGGAAAIPSMRAGAPVRFRTTVSDGLGCAVVMATRRSSAT